MLKEFCFYNSVGDYIQLSCSLRENYTLDDIRAFCEKLYAVKMDNTYSRINGFGKNNNTSNLKKCLMNMMMENVLSLEGIYHLFDTDEQRKNSCLSSTLMYFLQMFEFKKEMILSSEKLNVLIREQGRKGFAEENSKFELELRSCLYNTKLMYMTGLSFEFIKEKKLKDKSQEKIMIKMC